MPTSAELSRIEGVRVPEGFCFTSDAYREREAAAQQGGYGIELDPALYFLHDVPLEVAAKGEPHQRPEADAGLRVGLQL